MRCISSLLILILLAAGAISLGIATKGFKNWDVTQWAKQFRPASEIVLIQNNT